MILLCNEFFTYVSHHPLGSIIRIVDRCLITSHTWAGRVGYVMPIPRSPLTTAGNMHMKPLAEELPSEKARLHVIPPLVYKGKPSPP